MMNSLRFSWSRALLVLGIPVVFTSCETADNEDNLTEPGGGGAAAFLEVFPPTVTIGMAGDSVQLTGVVRDARGQKIEGAVVFWESLAPQVAMVTASGTVIGLDKGNAVIRGVHKTLSQSSQVVVAATPFPSRPVKLLIEPSTDTIPTVGGAVQLSLNALDEEGKLIANAPATWFSLDGGVAEVSNGHVSGRHKGLARILVTNGTLTDTALIYVQPTAPVDKIQIYPRADTIYQLGDVLPMRAVALDADGNPITGETVTLSSLDASVATVNGRDEVTAASSGVARITAAYGNKSDTSTIAVVPLEAATGVYITPEEATIEKVGEAVTFSVSVVGNSGNELPTKNVKWFSLDPYAVITGPGEVSGVKAGVSQIVAKYGAMTDTVLVTIAPAPAGVPASVLVTPKADTLTELGAQKQLVATVLDGNGSPIPGKTVEWSSSDESVAPVFASGVVAAAAPGSATITATHGSVSGSAQIAVVPVATPVEVTVQPQSDTIPVVGGTVTLNVDVMGSDGLLMLGEGATWRSLDGSIASVTGSGTPSQSTVVTGVAKGNARIVASNGLLADTALVMVASSPTSSPAAVKVTPKTDTIPTVGGTTKLTGVVVDAQGTTIPSMSVVWTALNPAIASVDGVGTVTALATGEARVKASYGTLADTALVRVPAPSNISWTVSHSPTYPSTSTTVTISAAASDPSKITSMRITVDGTLAKTCTGGTCSHAGLFPAGTHTYAVSATDAAGQTLSAGSGTFTVSQSWSGTGPSPHSPHWRHMRTSVIDYRIHYRTEPEKSAEYDWAAARYDHITGDPRGLPEYKKRNPTIRFFQYQVKFWFTPVADLAPLENWLSANGYPVENAFLHVAGTSKTRTNRIVAQQFAGRDYNYLNLGDPGYRAWRTQQTKQIMASGADGIFFDSNSPSTVRKYVPATTLEYSSYAPYFADYNTRLTEQRGLTKAGYIVPNHAQNFSKVEEMSIAQSISGGVMTEYENTPYGSGVKEWAKIDTLVAGGAVVQFSTGVSPGSKNTVRNDVNPGNYNTIAERVLMWEYCSYLMVADPARMDAVLFESYGLNWSHPFSVTWLTAYERDIGLALAKRSVYQSGVDGAGQNFSVYKREFSNGALVLIRPQSGTAYGDQTGVTVTLPAGTWRMLRADGSLSTAVTTAKIRNSEALIFIK